MNKKFGSDAYRKTQSIEDQMIDAIDQKAAKGRRFKKRRPGDTMLDVIAAKQPAVARRLTKMFGV